MSNEQFTDEQFLEQLRSIQKAFESLSRFPQYHELCKQANQQDSDFSLVDGWDAVIIALWQIGEFD